MHNLLLIVLSLSCLIQARVRWIPDRATNYGNLEITTDSVGPGQWVKIPANGTLVTDAAWSQKSPAKALKMANTDNSQVYTRKKWITTFKISDYDYLQIRIHVDTVANCTQFKIYLYPDSANTSNYYNLNFYNTMSQNYADSNLVTYTIPITQYVLGGTPTSDSIKMVGWFLVPATGKICTAWLDNVSMFKRDPAKDTIGMVAFDFHDYYLSQYTQIMAKFDAHGYKYGMFGAQLGCNPHCTDANVDSMIAHGHIPYTHISAHQLDYLQRTPVSRDSNLTAIINYNTARWKETKGTGYHYWPIFAWPQDGSSHGWSDSLIWWIQQKGINFGSAWSSQPPAICLPLGRRWNFSSFTTWGSAAVGWTGQGWGSIKDAIDSCNKYKLRILFQSHDTSTIKLTRIDSTLNYVGHLDTLGQMKIVLPHQLMGAVYAPDSLVIKKSQDSTITSFTTHDSLSIDADSAKIYRYDSSGGTWTKNDSTAMLPGGSLFSLTRTGLTANTRYYFRFKVLNNSGAWDSTYATDSIKTGIGYVTITSSAGTGGTVSPSGAIVVQALHDTSITATAAMGYRFALWTGSANVSIATPTTATTTFHSLDSSNGTITANFSRMWYASSPQTCYTHTSYNFPITAQNETIDSFKTSANPTLVCGLTLNHLTGTISGKPRAGTWYKWGYKIYGYHNGAIIDSCYDSMTISDVAPIDYQGMGHSIMQGAPYCTSQGSDSFEMQPMYWVSYYSGDTGTFHNWGLGGNSTFNTWYNLINYASGLQRKCTWILQGVKDYMWSSLSDTDANLIKRDTLIWYFDSMAKFLNNQHWKGVFCGMTPVVQPYIPSPGLPTFNDAFQRRHQLQKDQAYRHGLYFSDLWDSTIDLATGNLKTAYSYDGLHLTREGTKAIARAMVACYPPYIGKTYKTQCTIVYPDSAMPGGPDTTAWLFTVDLSRLPHAIIDSARIDGYDITVSGPFGELPKDLVFFNKIARTGVLHFRGYKNVKTYTVKSGSGAEYNSPYIYIDNKILQCYHLNDRSAVLSQGVFLDAASNVDGSVVTGITHGIVGPWGDTVSKFIFPPSPGYTYGKFIRSSEFSRRSKFSVSFALKQNTYSDAEIFTIYKASDAYKYLNCEIIGDSLQLQIADSIDNGLRNWIIKIPYTTAIADTGHWHHYLICLNNGIATAFLDGSKRVTTYNPLAVWNQTPSYDGGYDMWIGLNPLGGRGLNGGLSELRFLNTSFTDSEAVSYQKMEMLSTGMNVPTSSGGGFRRGGFGFGFFNWVQRAFR